MMTCESAAERIGARQDGELDAAAAAELDRHLAECPACYALAGEARALSLALESATRHRAPDSLRARLRPEPEVIRPRRWRRLALPAASLAGLAASLLLILAQPGTGDRLAEEVLASHLRSLQLPEHLVDVRSTDQHTVKPWFNGRLEIAPSVVDLGPQGFELVGGRLDYLDHQRGGALVYRRRQHLINLFALAAEARGESPPAVMAIRGFHIISWRRDGVAYWAVSDLALPELRQFAVLMGGKSGPE